MDYIIDDNLLELINNLNNEEFYGNANRGLTMFYRILAHMYHINHLGDRLVLITSGYSNEYITNTLRKRIDDDNISIYSTTPTSISLAYGPSLEVFSVNTVIRDGLPADEHSVVFFLLDGPLLTDSAMKDILNECIINFVDDTDIRQCIVGLSDNDLEAYI